MADMRTNPKLEVLKLNKESGFNYRERRHDDWLDNYTLGRDKVVINRLTQRQSVNLPLMKMTLKTILKDMDDMPVLEFEELNNEKDKEVFYNEYWKYTGEKNQFELQDIVDKKQEYYFGRTFDQWQIVDGGIKMTVQDPMDILVDRYMNPFDLHSSRFLIHTNIFTTLSELEKNPDYDKDAIKRLKLYYGTAQGLVKSAANAQLLQDKNEKLSEMGVQDIIDPVLGETYVILTLHFVYDKKKDSNEEELFLKVEVDDMEILLDKPLEEIIGVTEDHFFQNHFPYVTWAGDLERQDFWSDGTADMVRTPNKVANTWFSQLVENRTLRNLNMNLFDSTLEGFVPQSWQPQAWGMYGIPVPAGGKIDDVFRQLPVQDLTDSLDEMNFLIQMLEKGTGATPTQQGVKTPGQVTLGEVELTLGEAKERVKGASKFYTQAWKDRGLMFIKLLEAGGDKIDAVTVYKKGRNTDNIYSREISPEDWKSEAGYRCKVWSQDERNAENSDALQRANAAKTVMPDNPVVDDVYKRKVLEFADFSPDELNEAIAFEQEKRMMMMQQAQMGQMMGEVPPEASQPGMPAQNAAPNPQALPMAQQ
jgi:hypothetical protein